MLYSRFKRLAASVPYARKLWSAAVHVPRTYTGMVMERQSLLSQLQTAQSQLNAELFKQFSARFNAIETIKAHQADGLSAHPSFVTNFLGVRIDPKFFPSILKGKANTVEEIPIPANWHADIAEWAGALRAVDLAKDSFRVVELGCGWGCWLNNTGVAARRRGLKVELIGIEGDATHLSYAKEALETNGFTPDEYRLVHGVAAATNGRALFPVHAGGGGSWGSEPIFNASDDQIRAADKSGHYHVLDMVPLDNLVENSPIDLLHVDIQGGEAQFVESNLDTLNRLVRYMVIGTHSRSIEGDLCRALLGAGWELEVERPGIVNLNGQIPQMYVDGLQAWRAPRRASESSNAAAA